MYLYIDVVFFNIIRFFCKQKSSKYCLNTESKFDVDTHNFPKSVDPKTGVGARFLDTGIRITIDYEINISYRLTFTSINK